MAETWTAATFGIAPALNKYLLGIFNGAGSGRIFRFYKALVINMQTEAVTGVDLTLQFRLITAFTVGTGTTVTPVAHDTNNAALPAQLLVATAAQTVTDSSIYRVWHFSSDEGAVEIASMDEMEMLMPYALRWEAGAFDTTSIQPLTLREGEGIVIKCTTNSTVGTLDCIFEFTNDAA